MTDDELRDLIHVTPVLANGKHGMRVLIARANWDAWLQRRGPEVQAEGVVRLIITDYVPYCMRQFTAEDRERMKEETR